MFGSYEALKNMRYTAEEVCKAAAEALESWDFVIEDGKKEEMVLQQLIDSGGFEVVVGPGFRDLFDWLAEWANAGAGDGCM